MLHFLCHRPLFLTWFSPGEWTQIPHRILSSSVLAFRSGQIIFDSIRIHININLPHLRYCFNRITKECCQRCRNWHRGIHLTVALVRLGVEQDSYSDFDGVPLIPWQPKFINCVLPCSSYFTSVNLRLG